MRRLMAMAAIIGITAACGGDVAGPAADSTTAVEAAPTGPYIGQEPPGADPALFAPGIVSAGLDVRDVTMTPDGRELYFSAQFGSHAVIMETRMEGERWTLPEVAPFSGRYLDIEPCISPDGRRFFFMSTRPGPGERPEEGWVHQDIWVMDRIGDAWSEPTSLGPPVNTELPEYFPSVTADGTIYFTREQEDGSSRIMRSRPVDGGFAEPELLPPQVNLGKDRFNAFVAPDESFVIVPALGGPDDRGGVDYYVVFRGHDDRWSEPKNLGDAVNRPRDRQWSASLSPDGRFLFFMSSRTIDREPTDLRGSTLSELQALAAAPGAGATSVWWVDAGFIDELRP